MNDLIGRTIGQYQIIEKIGKGGMADVYKAYQPGLDRHVAIKILPEYFVRDETFLARFQREAKAIARLSHSHILPVYDFGQQGDLTYIVMQYVEAGTLKEMLGEPLDLQRAAEIIDQIASALDYAHRHEIIHRDVKPSNVLMGHGQRSLLSDFGLAKMTEASVQLTGSGVGVGTPAYMSPEQGQGTAVDARSDVYSLGVVLYEMVTGRVPYTAETPMAVVIKHITASLPLPRSVNPALPEVVERVILKALAKDPADRFASAGAMAQALRSAVVGLLIEAEQVPTPAEVAVEPPAELEELAPEIAVEPPPEPVVAPVPPAAEPAVAPAPPVVEKAVPAAAPKRKIVLPLAGAAVLLLLCVAAGVVLLRGRGAGTPATETPTARATSMAAAATPASQPTDTPRPTPTAVDMAHFDDPAGVFSLDYPADFYVGPIEIECNYAYICVPPDQADSGNIIVLSGYEFSPSDQPDTWLMVFLIEDDRAVSDDEWATGAEAALSSILSHFVSYIELDRNVSESGIHSAWLAAKSESKGLRREWRLEESEGIVAMVSWLAPIEQWPEEIVRESFESFTWSPQALRSAQQPTNTPKPTPTAIPSPSPKPGPATVRVASDGSGDYPSLVAAVEAVASGSTITLDAGTYRLQEPLEIPKPLRLVGAGMDQTEIASDYTILYTEAGLFGAEGLTFRYTGSDWGSVVTVAHSGAQVDLSRCRFTGGVWNEAEGKGGHGLWLGADTVGQVRDCRAEGNERHGILVSDQAQLTLEGNTCADNEQAGIVFTDNSGGTASDNDCSGNGLVGIGVDEQAEPMLEDNRCRENGEVGIAYWHNGGGIARSNECSVNNLHGIVVSDQAEPTLEKNVCARNQDSGIRYAGSAGGVARFNACSDNGAAGILVRDQARPTLEGNVCRDNGQAGIAYLGDASGLARENECSGNGHDGIGLSDQAAPTLEENVCTDDGEVGIHFSEESGGVTRDNECRGNRWGIFVAETADPNLEDDDCHDNAEADILDMRP